MKCYECTTQLSDYIDNMLTLQEQKEVEMHLKNCPSCTEELDSLKYMLDHINTLKETELPDSLHKDIMEQINKEITKEKNIIPFKTWTKYIASIAAVMLIVVVLMDPVRMKNKSPEMTASESPSIGNTEIAESTDLSDSIKANNEQTAESSMLTTEAPMLKRAAEDTVSSESKKDRKVMIAEDSIEEWEVVTSEKEKIVAAIKDYTDKNSLQAEYFPNEKDVSSITLYKILNKDELFEILAIAEPRLEITKKEEGGENLKVIIK